MTFSANWRTNLLTSALHAAEAVGRGAAIVDPQLAGALTEPSRRLAAEIRAADLPAARFWAHLVPLSAVISGRRQMVETAVTKTTGRGIRFDAIVGNLDACLAALETAVRSLEQGFADQLALRQRPLREQWEARGPGLVREMGRLTEPALMVENCDVLLVQPALGGSGEAHLAYNSVRIEAVLANPIGELPEIVRLAWLIAQLQLDLPIHSEGIHADRLPHIGRYAMLPAALIAAETVELLRFTPGEIARAITVWNLAAPRGVDAAEIVSQWWQTYVETRPPWRVALTALDQMFG
jgi:hypothetical protein